MSRAFSILVTLSLILRASGAHADEAPDDFAMHVENGRAYARIGRCREALVELRAARKLRADPAVDQEIAHCEQVERERAPAAPKSGPPRHAFGIGLGAGLGYDLAETRIGNFSNPVLDVFHLDLFFGLSGSFEFQLRIPVGQLIMQNLNGNGPFFATELAARIFLSGTSSGFFLGPGVGFSFLSTKGASAEELSGAFRVGYELPTAGRGFGLAIAVKPSVGALFASAGTDRVTGVSFGIAAELGFHFYSTRGP